MIADLINNKKLTPVALNVLLEKKNWLFQLCLLHNHTLKCQKMFKSLN